jgi:hypothetical protein
MLSLSRKSRSRKRIYVRWAGRGKMAMSLFAIVIAGCTEPTIGRVASPKQIVLEPPLEAKVEAALAKSAWVSDLHAKAMDDVITWATNNKRANRREQCAMIMAVGMKFSAQARSDGHIDTSPREDSLGLARAAQATSLCSNTGAMNIFAKQPLLPSFSFARFFDESQVESYIFAIQNAFVNSGGSGDQVMDALASLLVQADADPLITEPELETIVSHVQLLLSSVGTWYGYQQAGTFGSTEVDPNGPVVEDPLSIFGGYNQYNFWIIGQQLRWLWGRCNYACRQIGAQDLVMGWFGFKWGGGLLGMWQGSVIGSAGEALSHIPF